MKKSKLTKVLCFVLSLMMILCAAPVMAFAADSVTYVDRTWDATEKKVVEETKTASATPITGSEATLEGGWYVVNESVTASAAITVNGDDSNPTRIILADGCTLTAKSGGITVCEGKTLFIYGQANGTGKLEASGSVSAAGIGGSKGNGGTVTIYGGTVKAIGSSYSSGIGGGSKGNGGTVTVYGGTVTATGYAYGAGIGGGYRAGGGTFTIYGGTVNASSSSNGAGIGRGGSDVASDSFNDGSFIMYGGTVKAISGSNGAGIGAGRVGTSVGTSNGTVTVNCEVAGTATDSTGTYKIFTDINGKPFVVYNDTTKDINNSSFSSIELHVYSHTHVFAATWSSDAAGHWHACTAKECNILSYATCGIEDVAYAAHTFENGVCTVCDYECQHSFASYVYNNDAKCEVNGTETAKCENCDATDTREAANTALEHIFTNYVSNNDATCIADGTKTAKCENCDATDTVADTGSKTPHTFVNYVYNDDAECGKNGTETAQCENCTATDTREAANTALAHDFTGAAKDNGDGTHSFLCKNGCGEYGAPADHTGMDDGICDDCGYTKPAEPEEDTDSDIISSLILPLFSTIFKLFNTLLNIFKNLLG